MPYPLIFPILPLILPKTIRDSLPKRVDSSIQKWLHEDYPEHLIILAENIRIFVPYTKESLVFAIQYNRVYFEKDRLIADKATSLNVMWDNTSEAIQCYKAASFMGRWFANLGETVTIFRKLGIRP